MYNGQYALPSAPPAVTRGVGKFPGTRFAAKVANDATCVWQLCSKLLNFCDTVSMVASNGKIYILPQNRETLHKTFFLD